MYDISMIRAMGDQLFKTLDLSRVLNMIERDASADRVKLEASIAAMLLGCLEPNALPERRIGLVVGMLFSEYGISPNNPDNDNLSTATAYLRSYWAKDRDIALTDVSVANAARVIQSRWLGSNFDLLDTIAHDARILRQHLSDRKELLATGGALINTTATRVKTQPARDFYHAVRSLSTHQDDTHLASIDRKMFSFRADDPTSMVTLVVHYTEATTGYLTAMTVGVKLNELPVDGKTQLIIPNQLWVRMNAEMLDWLSREKPTFHTINKVVPINNRMWSDTGTYEFIVVNIQGTDVLVLLNRNGCTDVHDNEFTYYVTLNGIPTTAAVLGDVASDDPVATYHALAVLSSTSPIPGPAMHQCNRLARNVFLKVRRKKQNVDFIRSLLTNWFKR